MGNHEFNALAYHTEDRDAPGEYLRRRSSKNEKQHGAPLEPLTPQELRSHLEWFRTLPMWLDLDGLRVAHACWDERAIGLIAEVQKSHGGITTEFLHFACREGNPLFAPVEVVLKGKESKLPEGASFQDKDGHVRTEIRTRWYLSLNGHTYRVTDILSEKHAGVFGGVTETRKTAPKQGDLIFQFKITLLDIKPAIGRRMQVPECTLADLHEHIQAAFGWWNYHMHQFDIDGERYGPLAPDDMDFGLEMIDETGPTLKRPFGTRLSAARAMAASWEKLTPASVSCRTETHSLGSSPSSMPRKPLCTLPAACATAAASGFSPS